MCCVRTSNSEVVFCGILFAHTEFGIASSCSLSICRALALCGVFRVTIHTRKATRAIGYRSMAQDSAARASRVQNEV